MATESRVTPIWNAAEIHANLMSSLDESFEEIRQSPNFDSDWRLCKCCPGTKTMIRQSPLMGMGGGNGRKIGGFWKFAAKYALAEGGPSANVRDYCGYDRYQDFTLYSHGPWEEGKKYPILCAEVESNSGELLGELAGLRSINCPYKYLFITTAPGILDRLVQYCEVVGHRIPDWSGTTYYVVEMPLAPSPPSSWTAYRAEVSLDRERLVFKRLV